MDVTALRGLLRIARKYGDIYLRDKIVSKLMDQYPTSLPSRDHVRTLHGDCDKFGRAAGFEFDLLQLALDHDLFTIKPLLLYDICHKYSMVSHSVVNVNNFINDWIIGRYKQGHLAIG